MSLHADQQTIDKCIPLRQYASGFFYVIGADYAVSTQLQTKQLTEDSKY